jgi:hypothetical protein
MPLTAIRGWAPNDDTSTSLMFSFLEIIYVRWGTVAHIVFMFFGLATNVIVSSKSLD